MIYPTRMNLSSIAKIRDGHWFSSNGQQNAVLDAPIQHVESWTIQCFVDFLEI